MVLEGNGQRANKKTHRERKNRRLTLKSSFATVTEKDVGVGRLLAKGGGVLLVLSMGGLGLSGDRRVWVFRDWNNGEWKKGIKFSISMVRVDALWWSLTVYSIVCFPFICIVMQHK